MKFVSVLMSVILAGIFANAQGEAAPASKENAKLYAPVKKEKKQKKRHGKKGEKKEEHGGAAEGMNK